MGKLSKLSGSSKKGGSNRGSSTPQPLDHPSESSAIDDDNFDDILQEAQSESVYTPPKKKRTPPKIADLRKKLRGKLLATPDEFDDMEATNPEHRKMVAERLKTVLQRANIQLSKDEYRQLEEALINDLLGFGAIEPLVQDRSYSEIMVNGPEIVFAEFKGKLQETRVTFDDEDHIQWVAQRIVRPMQREFDRGSPMVDARLPDGSRVHLIMPPSALQGTTMTIRKFPEKPLGWRDLVNFGSFTEEVAEFLRACVQIHLNIVVSGGTGSGKTTLLNVLSSFIPDSERIITVEDSAELQLQQRHVVRLETCPPKKGSTEGALKIRDLVKGSLRMRPDRIIVGEIRDGAALDMLQAMNTGHDGSLTTVHANGPRDAVARLETLALMAGMDLPISVIRQQIASAIHMIVQQSRLKDGSRKIIQITEVQGMEGEFVTLQDAFLYLQEGERSVSPSAEGGGFLQPTGLRPKFADRFESAGIKLPPGTFGSNAMFGR
jgi:pilus assembly protein CpaF